eukprot:3091913-Amphidinium_carterae.1
MVFATSGMKHEEAVKLATSSLGGVKAGVAQPHGDSPYFCGAELIYRNDEMGSVAYTSVGWKAVPWRSPDAVTFMVMASIIGSYKKDSGLLPGNISGNRVTNAIANKMGVGCADEYEGFVKFYRSYAQKAASPTPGFTCPKQHYSSRVFGPFPCRISLQTQATSVKVSSWHHLSEDYCCCGWLKAHNKELSCFACIFVCWQCLTFRQTAGTFSEL